MTQPRETPARKALDADGVLLKPGDAVQWAQFGDKAILRHVEAVGRESTLAGYVMVTGFLGWQPATNFRKVTQ